jgi:flagellar biosynthesis component FlhA
VEQALQEAEISTSGLPLAIEDGTFEALSSGLHAVLKSAFELGAVPVAILCSSEVRDKVLSLARGLTRPLFVLSYEELDPVMLVEQIGTWELVSRQR